VHTLHTFSKITPAILSAMTRGQAGYLIMDVKEILGNVPH